MTKPAKKSFHSTAILLIVLFVLTTTFADFFHNHAFLEREHSGSGGHKHSCPVHIFAVNNSGYTVETATVENLQTILEFLSPSCESPEFSLEVRQVSSRAPPQAA